ncbi:LOW QUALITY PROTEIN: hypothetical protein Smp_110730, partial [Schistosoma mansoni]
VNNQKSYLYQTYFNENIFELCPIFIECLHITYLVPIQLII